MSRPSDETTCLPGTRAAARDLHLVTFRVGDWTYAVEVADVCGVYHGVAIIPTPDEPEIIAGEINLGTHRIPVVDLRTVFHLPDRFGAGWLLVVTRTGDMIGIIVDHVSGVIRVTPEALEPFDRSSDSSAPGDITAVARCGNEAFHIPDLSRILDRCEG